MKSKINTNGDISMTEIFREKQKILLNEKIDLKLIKGLIWYEWLAYKNIIIISFTIWFACSWILLIFSHPYWILIFGMVYAVITATSLNGPDASDGSEEFLFSLPPTRSQRYLARLSIGGATLMFFCVTGLAVIAFDLPQFIWSIFMNSGFTEPFMNFSAFTYTLSFLMPVSAFSLSFALAPWAGSHRAGNLTWFLGILYSVLIMLAGFYFEKIIWKNANGIISCPLLAISGAASLLTGYRLYIQKESISRSGPVVQKKYYWIILLITGFVIMISLALLMKFSS